MKDVLQEIAYQLKRIADQGEQTTMQLNREDALAAWGLRIYQADYLRALQQLGIDITD
jgi:hypothetical protein